MSPSASPRSRDRILGNLESIYREAYERAKAASDQVRMADLDAAYQREQLLLEVLLDIRDALTSLPASAEPGSGKTSVPSRSCPVSRYQSAAKTSCSSSTTGPVTRTISSSYVRSSV